MIYFLVTYLLFEIAFDHWGGPSDLSAAVYFSFQYGWVAALSLYHFVKVNKMVFILIAALFAALSIDEWISYLTGYPETTASPTFVFTIFVIAIYLLYELLEWRKRKQLT